MAHSQDLLIQRLKALNKHDLMSLLVGGLRLRKLDLQDLEHASLVSLCSTKLRGAAGSSTFNLTRNSHDFPYKQLLIDVADKIAPGNTPLSWTKYRLNDQHTESEIEQQILDFFDEQARRWWQKLPAAKRDEFTHGVNTVLHGHTDINQTLDKGAVPFLQRQAIENLIQGGLVGGLAQLSASGALGVLGISMVGQLGWIILVQTVGWMAGLKIAIFGLGGYGAAGGAVSVLGSAAIGGAVALPGLIALIDGPAYRKTVPTTVMLLAKLRLNQLENTQV